MALVVEDGSAKSDAESYVSVNEADAYFAKYGNTTWAGAQNAAKEIALRKATDYMVSTFRGSWAGMRTVAQQALDWPRAYVVVDEFDIANNVVPREVKAACCELAIVALTSALMPTTAGRTKKRVKVGPLEVEYDGDGSGLTAYVAAVQRLEPFLTAGSGGMSMKVVRC